MKSLSKKLLSGVAVFAILAAAIILFTNFVPANNIGAVDVDEVLGKWNVVSFVREVEDFNPADISCCRSKQLWWQSVEFSNDGMAVANIGNRRNNTLTWAEGEMEFRGWWSQDSPAYAIKTIDGTEYLFIEWTQPSYVVQGTGLMYFVFERVRS
ncbi:MAG: hypothetical protein FWC97_04180 [Treponema sp.]|nr:hypothetical protein [Treponema sp.]